MPFKNPEEANAWQRAWYEANKEKKNAYYKANIEKIKAYREATKVKRLAYAKAHYKANIEKKKAYDKAYAKANKEKVNAKLAKRRAAKLNRTPGWLTKEDLGKMQELYRVAQKKTRIEGIEYHVDHTIPLQGKNISGLHVPDNLQVIKATENIRKNNRYTI